MPPKFCCSDSGSGIRRIGERLQGANSEGEEWSARRGEKGMHCVVGADRLLRRADRDIRKVIG